MEGFLGILSVERDCRAEQHDKDKRQGEFA